MGRSLGLTVKMQVLLLRDLVEAGSDDDGARHTQMYVPALPRVDETDAPLPPQRLPYFIWRTTDGNRVLFRWARRTRGKPTLGISTHGSAPDLHGAIEACLQNHADRLELERDQ